MGNRCIKFLLYGVLASGASFQMSAEQKKESPIVAVDGMTADEAFDKGRSAFNAKRYDEAAAIYTKFREDFGKSEAAKNALKNTKYPLAICFIKLGRHAESISAIHEALELNPALTPDQILELQFLLGAANLQVKDQAAAREAFQKFVELADTGSGKPGTPLISDRISEARLLIGLSWINEGRLPQAAEYFQKVKNSLPPDRRGRAVVFQLHALQESGDHPAAINLIREESSRINEISQLISFQMIVLKMGNRFLEKGEFRQAIFCLQSVWSFQRIIDHQEEKIATLKNHLKSYPEDAYESQVLGRHIEDANRELEAFRKFESFDASLRFRLAKVYLQMNRYHESALIMEDMVARLPADKTTEQAAINVIRCWNALESWPQAILAAQTFIRLFPASSLAPEALLLEAQAYQASMEFEKAAQSYEAISKSPTASDAAPRALFLKGFTLLQAEKNKDSADVFKDFLTRYPKHELADEAAYWIGMAWSFDKQYEKCRQVMDDYLKRNPQGRYRGAAAYRKAYCAQQMEKYGTAVDELTEYLDQYPGEPENNEARVLLGNAMMNEGFIEEAIKVFDKIPPTDQKMHEEAVFRIADGLKALEKLEEYRDHLRDFIAQNPKSPRVAEAIASLGWYYRQAGQPDTARDMYWKAVRDYGNDPEIRSVDDLIPALAKYYKGPEESARYLTELQDMAEQTKGKKTLLQRLLYAQAQSLKKSEPNKARVLLIEASGLSEASTTNPALLVDFAEALREDGQNEKAENLLIDTLRWNPRALQKDRILAALGQLELQKGNEKAALDYFNRFEKESLGSVIFGGTMLARAKLLQKRGSHAEAQNSLESVLSSQSATGQQKAEALCLIGDIYMSDGKPDLAIPYYQRVYVMHARWKPWVAKAYLRSGQAFEKLQDTRSARKTYEEFVKNTDFADFPEASQAQDRLKALAEKSPQT
jgi:tetratricopeptide (TPR) repeat protein